LFVDDSRVPAVVDLIKTHAHTGAPGDGKIIVSQIEQIVRIRSKQPAA
jgi:nitrogen regulatory protein PII